MPNPSESLANKEPAEGSEPLKDFQLTTQSISQKSTRAYGLSISKKIYGTVASGLGGYYFSRNARYEKNRNYANGRINVQAMFQDRFRFDGKTNYIALNWQTLQIVNRIVSGLVGRWMKKGEKVQVTAIDPLSVKQKKEQYDEMDFIINNRKQLEILEQESGVQIIPRGQMIPQDEEELRLWQAQAQRLPEEIKYQLGCNDVLASSGWFDVLKEMILHDAAETLFVGTYTWMDSEGVIHVEKVEPEDAIYSATKYSDFRDTAWRGQMPSRKISEIRRKWGKEFNPDNPNALTEQQLFQIAQTAVEYKRQSNMLWLDEWFTAFVRPYDEWNVRCMEFELKSVDSEPYTITKTKATGTTYTQKGLPATVNGKTKKPSPNQKVLSDTNWNIYRGVYLPDSDDLLEWGLKTNMICPQDPREVGNAEFSYSFYMPQNYQMRNLAIPEKIEAAVDGMILALLKMQQVVGRMRPTGAAIDETALQNIDYGLGEAGNKGVDYKKLYDQTGDIYYRSVDAEGNKIPIPIIELQNNGFLGQMDGLIKNYQFNYQALKDELGEDPNLISQALQPRVTADNVEASQLQSEYATDYIYNAYAYCMADTARKVACLLKDSVLYGAKAYRKAIGADDISDRNFATKIQFLPSQHRIDMFRALMTETMKSTPELVLFIDPFELLRVAEEDVDLAEMLFRRGQKKMLLHQQQVAQQNQQQTIQGQIDAAVKAEEEKRKTKDMELAADLQSTRMQSEAQNKSTVLTGAFAMLQKQQETGAAIPNEYMPLIKAVMENVALAAAVSTEDQKKQVLGEMQQAAAMQQDQSMEEMQQPEQQPVNQPPVAA